MKTMAIEFKNVCFSYQNKSIFQNLTIKFPDTGLVVILGSSGSGKTTFLSLLTGLLKSNSGEIINSHKDDLSYIYQSPLLINYLTVKENIETPLLINDSNDEENTSDNIIKLLELEGLENKYPYQLSGGEQVRVSIARGLIKGGNVLILDEPTGQLDELNSDKIFSLLKKISETKLVIVVTHDEIKGLEISDYLYELKNHTLINKKEKEVINKKVETISKIESSKKNALSIKNACFFSIRFIKQNKLRLILSSIFLIFNFTLIYLGLNLNNNVDAALVSILDEYYANDLVKISKQEKISSSSSLSLSKQSMPDDEVINLLNIKETYTNLSFFFPSYQEIYLNNQIVDVQFVPVIKEQENKLEYGSTINESNNVVVNQSFLDEIKLDTTSILNKTINISRDCLVYTRQFKESDIININLSFKITGISKEKKPFNQPLIYFSYSYLYDYLATIELKNISSYFDEKTTIDDLLSSKEYDDEDIKSNSLYILSDRPWEIKKQAEYYFDDKVNISSITLDIKESTQEIITSLLKVLTMFLVLNTLAAIALQFLITYSLYEDNLRLFALLKVYTNNKKSVVNLALSQQLIISSLTVLFTLLFGIFSAKLINIILLRLNYPDFLTFFDLKAFILIIIIHLLTNLLSGLLPLRKIRDSEIKKELEGED